MSKCCGHIFCKSCLNSFLHHDSTNTSNTCPICRADNFVSITHHQADQEIKGLLIHCPNKSSGCGWYGELNDINKHIKDGECCDIKCRNCDEVVPNTDITRHLDEDCPCYCPYCDSTADREVISSKHKEKCHKFPLTCPNNCGVDNIPQGDMDEHKKVCPLELIQCEYHDVGCETVMPRKDLSTHNRLNRLYHLQLACSNQTTQAVTMARSFTTTQYSWSQLVFIFFIVTIMQAVIIKVDQSREEFQCIQESYPTLWPVLLNQLNELSMHGDQVAPVVLKMSNFTDRIQHIKGWYSSPFFAFIGSYQMFLGIHPAHTHTTKVNHTLNISLYLMQGSHDDQLRNSDQLMINGTFTIELLNQLNDNHHFTIEATLNSEECTELMVEDQVVRKWGHSLLIAHDTILLSNSNTKYIMNNSVYFRISHKKAVSTLSFYDIIVRPLLAGGSLFVIFMIVGVICEILPSFDSVMKYDLLFTLTYYIALGSVMEGSLIAGITWTLLFWIILGCVANLSSNTVYVVVMLLLSGCLAKMLLAFGLSVWNMI